MRQASRHQYKPKPWPDEHMAEIVRVGRGWSAHCLFTGDQLTLCGRRISQRSGVGWHPHRYLILDVCADCEDAWQRFRRAPTCGSSTGSKAVAA